MNPIVSIIMGSTSDMPVLEKAAKLLDEFEIPFEINALSAHRTPQEVTDFANNASKRGLKVIIAAAGMAAHLPGVIAAQTTVPVIGVPIKSTLEGMDALLAIVQMPPGIPSGNRGHQCRAQRRHSCRADAVAHRRAHRRAFCGIQAGSCQENRESQRRPCPHFV